MQLSSFGRKFRNDVFVATAAVSFFQNLTKPADIYTVTGA